MRSAFDAAAARKSARIPQGVLHGEATAAADAAENDQARTVERRTRVGCTSFINSVPLPEVIDSARMKLLYNIEPPSEALGATITRLHRDAAQAKAYGAALFEQLIAVREYLMDDIARGLLSDTRSQTTDTAGTAKFHEDVDWQRWRDTYIGVASLLAGPAGDSGFAADTAAAELQRKSGSL